VRELKEDYGVEKCFAWRVDGPLDSPGLLEDAKLYDAYFAATATVMTPRRWDSLPACLWDGFLHLSQPAGRLAKKLRPRSGPRGGA